MLLRNTFLKNLRDRRKALFWWSIALIAFVLMICSVYPSVKQSGEAMKKYLEVWPEYFKAAFLGEVTDITTPEGFLNAELFFFTLPLMFLIYAIGFGGGAIAGEEEAGTLDLLLANPLPRWRVVLEKFLAMLAGMAILSFVFWLSLVISVNAFDIEVGLGPLAAATLSSALLGFSFGVVALAVGCATGKRGASIGIATTLTLASYLLNTLAQIVESFKDYQKLSLFYYHVVSDPLTNGLKMGDMAVFIGTIAVFLVIALIAFQHRDLAV